MLRTEIDRAIAERGPLPFEEFMRLALYHPDGGFFAGDTLRSVKAGDFLTSPEVSPLFGATLARFVAAERDRLDVPDGFCVVEAGAGSGSLLAPLLEHFEPTPAAWAIEVSPPARAALAAVVGEDRVVSAPGELPQLSSAVVVANELIDNIPMAIAVREDGGWTERFVGREGDELVMATVPARPEVATWADRFGGDVPTGALIEVQLEAGAWLREVVDRLTGGTIVLIDYGGTTEELVPRRTRGTLRTYRAHHLGPDPLLEPGATDITADVNFTALAATLADAGLDVELHRQDVFLTAWGLRDRLSELRHRELDLARSGDATERLQVRSLRADAEALLHPRGLGDFRVLVGRR